MSTPMDLTYRLERSDRKNVQLKICPDGSLLVKAPLRYSKDEIDALIARHSRWVATHRAAMEKRTARVKACAQTPEQIDALFRQAEEIIPNRVAYFSHLMGVTPTGVRITSAQKRFGSCSSENSLCFSYRVMMYPHEAIDYVVVHELAHIRHHNHSREFYQFIETVLPDYRHREAILKEQL